MKAALDPVLSFFAARAVPRVEEAADATFRRTLLIRGRPALVEVALSSDGASVDVDDEDLGHEVRNLVDRAFDVNGSDGEALACLKADPALAPLIEVHPDIRIPGTFDPAETATRAVLGQQVSIRGAATLAGRIVARVDERFPRPTGRITHLFPPAGSIAEADLAGIGMPAKRVSALRSLAEAIADGSLPLEWGACSSPVRERLLGLPGIGEWTASYICMRALGDRDAFPATDLGIRKGAAALGLPASPRALAGRAERWRPFRAYAASYLWFAAAGNAGRPG